MSNGELKVNRVVLPEDQSARVDQSMVISVSGEWGDEVIKDFQNRMKELLGSYPGHKILFVPVSETPQADLISSLVRILEEEGCSIRVVNRVKALRLVETS